MSESIRLRVAALTVLVGLGVAALVTGAPGVAASSGGLADVACAGSLQLLMDHYLGPSFTSRTGDQYQGLAAGSLGLAQEILAGEIRPNVFVPVGHAPLALLEPRFTGWAIRFAASPLVLAYYPKGPHAKELRKIAQGKLPIQDLFTLMATPGFRLGRTDPAIDPQGQAFEMMIQLAEKHLHVSRRTGTADLGGSNGPAQIFSETALEPDLQAGQLDAASAFLPQAVQLHLPYIALPALINFGDPKDARTYSQATLTIAPKQTVRGSLLDLEVAVLKGSDQGAADAFVAYLMSGPARRTLAREGYELLKPTLLGKSSAAPSSIRDAVRKA
ncbi:MAG TPA: extracellular solute-binding protein [Candidatus Dormibacteraeota bacterium]|nr:extracellular solute-binding protein [Candidatus Dormibacteraeota bacterium]